MVENRDGGDGANSLEACAQAAPDGHTFCSIDIENITNMPHAEPALHARYASKQPVPQMASTRSVIAAGNAVPAAGLRAARWPGRVAGLG